MADSTSKTASNFDGGWFIGSFSLPTALFLPSKLVSFQAQKVFMSAVRMDADGDR